MNLICFILYILFVLLFNIYFVFNLNSNTNFNSNKFENIVYELKSLYGLFLDLLVFLVFNNENLFEYFLKKCYLKMFYKTCFFFKLKMFLFSKKIEKISKIEN